MDALRASIKGGQRTLAEKPAKAAKKAKSARPAASGRQVEGGLAQKKDGPSRPLDLGATKPVTARLAVHVRNEHAASHLKTSSFAWSLYA